MRGVIDVIASQPQMFTIQATSNKFYGKHPLKTFSPEILFIL